MTNKKNIISREENYSQWYLDVVSSADLAENSVVRGSMIIKPYGYAIWETMKDFIDKQLKLVGVENVYFPMFIPEKFLKLEEDHVEGFAPEVAVVTHAGGKKLNEPYVVRPTSETLMYDTFSRWIQSYRDLPLLINQWANVVRWEMRPRLFLRTTEFLWQEGHTAHETEEDADQMARRILDIYKDFAENILAIPVIPGVKSDSEKFAGALKTYTIEAMMQDGKALQFGTSHNLGINFAKVFDVKFLNRDGGLDYAWQTSWGVSTRMIGGLIMAHSDDKGLVLPPKIAPYQFVIATIVNKNNQDSINEKATEIYDSLLEIGLRGKIDLSDKRPGEKFYEWEKKGVPVRIELGPKDIEKGQVVLVRRDNSQKYIVNLDDLNTTLSDLLDNIQLDLYNKSLDRLDSKSVEVDTWDDFKLAIKDGNFVSAHWSGDADVEQSIKEETGATIRCIPFVSDFKEGTCIKGGRKSKCIAIFAKAY